METNRTDRTQVCAAICVWLLSVGVATGHGQSQIDGAWRADVADAEVEESISLAANFLR